MSVSLSFVDVRRRFASPTGEVVALDGITVELAAGSFTAIVGPSGSGKSTLLHIAAGLDTGYEGVFRRTPADAVAACVFQEPRLLPWLNARRNVSFVIEGRGRDAAAARARADEMLALVGLPAAAGQFPAALSGGMRQRVALARALAVDPDLLLLDEPFSAVDEPEADRLHAHLMALCLARARTVVLVTHRIREACWLADRVIVISSAGRLAAEIEVPSSRPREPGDPRLVDCQRQVAAVAASISAR